MHLLGCLLGCVPEVVACISEEGYAEDDVVVDEEEGHAQQFEELHSPPALPNNYI